MTLTPEQLEALQIARSLAAAGIPVFVAEPDPSSSTGYRLPPRWQEIRADPTVVDAWRPGMALAMVMGHGLDLLDVDPRSGGNPHSLNGATPTSYAAAVTPSGGVHSFIRSLGVRSRDSVVPGIDVKAGDPEGRGRGFAFIAPTVRVSKVTGQPTPYRWATPPDVTRLAAVLRGEIVDASGAALRTLIEQARGAGSATPKADPGEVIRGGIPPGQQDVELSRMVMRWRTRGLSREEAAELWWAAVKASEVDPARPWTDADFERHWSGADRKATAEEEREAQAWRSLGLDPQAPPPSAPPGTEPPPATSADVVGSRYFGPGGLQAASLAGDVLAFGPLRVGRDDVMWSYNAGVWRADKHVVRDRLTRLLGQRFRTSYTGTVEAVVRAHVDTITCDPVPFLINFRNGLLEWQTGTLKPHDPEFPTTVQLAVDYDPDAECPAFDRFLSEVVPPDVVQTIWELIGYLMYSGNPLHKAVMLTGTGRNGKGTFLRVVEAVLGSANVTSVSLHDLVNTRFTTASLFGKLANIAGDIDAGYLENTATFKAITGGDTISAEHKGRDRFDFKPWAVPMFSANKIPASADTSVGYLSRWLVVPFPHDFSGREDRHLNTKLHAPGELRGIAAKGIRHLGPLLARGDFMLTASGEQAREEFIRRVDQVRTWIGDCCSIRPEHPWIPRTELYAAYKQWAFRDGHKPVRASEFYDRLEQAGAEPATVHGTRGFKRIAIHDNGLAGPAAAPSASGTPSTPRGAAPSVDPAPSLHPPVSAGQDANGPDQGAEGAGNPQPPYARTRAGKGVEAPAPPAPTASGLDDVPESPTPGPVIFDLETADAEQLCTYGAGFVRLGGFTCGGEVRLTSDTDRLTTYLNRADLLVGHNILGFDLLALARYHGLDLHALVARGAVFDTLLAARHLDPPQAKSRKRYDLDSLAERLGFPGKSTDLKKLAKEFGGYDRIPLDEPRYREYLKRDVLVSLGVYSQLQSADPYLAREHRVAAIAGQITLNGFAVDRDLLDVRLAEVAARKTAALEELEEVYGLPLADGNGEAYRSPLATDAGKAAIETALAALGVNDPPRTEKTGALQITGAAMDKLAQQYPAAARLCELVRTVVGARTIYQTIDTYAAEGERGWRVHPSVSMEQSTGRWSISKPGLTVVGKRGQRYHERDVFLPDPGEVLLSVDLSQVDARAVAALSGDPAYRDMFAPGRDLHAEMAQRVWGDSSRREEAKAIGHGWNYGMGIGKLAMTAGTDVLTAQQFDAAMRYQFPELVAWRDNVRAIAAAGMLLDNGFGRKMNPDPERAHTQGPAFMGQGAARDLMMEGLLRLPRELYPMLRAVVHDEVVLSVPADIARDVADTVTAALSFEWRGVPIIAEPQKTRDGQVRFGRTWGDLYAKEAA